MKKLSLLSTLMLVMMVAFLPQNLKAQVSVWDGTYAPWTNGTGTEADPFLIENAQQLAYLANRVNNGLDAAGGHISNHDLYYKLMTDVDLNGSEDFQWTPIGLYNNETNYYCFGGHFDGNNHIVSGLYINTSSFYVGFFGYTNGSFIKHLHITGEQITTINDQSTQLVCSGGIVGKCVNTNINSCSCDCSVTAERLAPGESEFASCFSYAGGIVGQAVGVNHIINCYNTSDVEAVSYNCHSSYFYSAFAYAAGIVGMADDTTNVENCYNSGSIHSYALSRQLVSSWYGRGYYNSGGCVGFKSDYSNTANCYYLDTCGGNNTYGGSPMTAEVMRTPEFVGMLNNGSCAWEQDVPPMVNDGYPILTMIVEEAYTEPATDLTATSALLHGSISVDHATVTSKGFEYRAVGDSVYTALNVTGNNEVFSYFLNGLTPNTTYEYRTFVNVMECPYTAYGNIQTFEVSWLNADTIYIYDADMLRWVSDRCNSGTTFAGKYIQLMNNIVLPLNQPNNMTSIGRYPSYPFSGTFDGNGLTISNLYIDQPNTEYQGFFGYTRDANLYEVGLVNITASGRNYTGGMVAYAQNTYMHDCYVNGGTLFALSYCGGLVGYQQQGTNSIISGCYNTCTVSGNHYVGGLVGFSNYATVRNSYVAASVAGQGNAIGAIIGGANEVLMYNCYFSSTITGQSSAIGENNFKDGEGLSDEEMRDPAFVVTLNQGLVTPVWKSDYATPINNGFPILIWQYSDAEACEAPENLTATVNGNSALLSWTSGDNANYFIVEYGMVGETPQQENTPNNQFTIHNVQEGTYFWRVKSVCSFGESNFVNGENIITGITNYDGSDLTLYPNPTTGIVNVQFTMNNGQLADGEIMVFDVYGRMLSVVGTRCTTSLQTVQIDLSQYATGIYIVKLVNGGRVVATGKVVKQ